MVFARITQLFSEKAAVDCLCKQIGMAIFQKHIIYKTKTVGQPKGCSLLMLHQTVASEMLEPCYIYLNTVNATTKESFLLPIQSISGTISNAFTHVVYKHCTDFKNKYCYIPFAGEGIGAYHKSKILIFKYLFMEFQVTPSRGSYKNKERVCLLCYCFWHRIDIQQVFI